MSQTDPLKSLPEQERALFEVFRQASSGKNIDVVIGACVNMLINVLRQTEPTRKEAEARWDMLFGRGKSLLLENHYDAVTGRRRSIFPHTQVIRAAYHHDDDDLIQG